MAARQREAENSAAVIGAHLFLEDLPDTEFSAGGDTVRRIEAVVHEVAPSILYVHSEHDRHQDHRAVHQAARVAARSVNTVACYQSPSSTVTYQPNQFVSVDGYFETKLRMLAMFDSQSGRDYLRPEIVRAAAAYWAR